jgi:hypothetical protein
MTTMSVGMLWFDGDSRNSLRHRIDRAAKYYQEKYGQAPTVCFVNPTTAGQEPPSLADMNLETSHSVLPDHFWLGMSSEPQKPSG